MFLHYIIILAMRKREYKDTVFVDLFFHCEEAYKNFALLFRSLCEFLNINFHFEMEDLQPVSLENSLYNGRRTDVLYSIRDSLLVFVEHQSTVNPNMPLRYLEYAVEVLKKLTCQRAKYAASPLDLKDIFFLNLYNGKEKVKDVYDTYLSDLIKLKINKDVSLELKVTNININAGCNEKLMKACPVLKEYSLFVAEARKQLELDRQKGFDIAVDNCIKRGILSKYLNENRRGVMGLFFGEFNMDTALEVAREESYDKGIKKGIERGMEKGIERGREEGILTTAKNFLSLGIPIEDVIKATGLPRAELESL